MGIIKFSNAFEEKTNSIFEIISKGTIDKYVSRILNWKYNTATKLTPWLENQVLNPGVAVILAAKQISDYTDYDKQVVAVLKSVQQRLLYKGDKQKWNVPEVWSTAEETITASGYYTVNGEKVYYGPWEGDCEDGAILAYVLCRLKGVPANRLQIMAGDVLGGGHAWLAYRPNNYPLNFAFLDWCYWYSSNQIVNRNLFYMNDKLIFEYATPEYNIHPNSNYKKLWVVFNEEKSNTGIQYNFRTVEGK